MVTPSSQWTPVFISYGVRIPVALRGKHAVQQGTSVSYMTVKYSYVHTCYVERLLTESEANLCWPSTSLVLLAPFVWLMSECGPEEKARVTCVPQQQKQEVVLLLLTRLS